jgi:hypothetical protein
MIGQVVMVVLSAEYTMTGAMAASDLSLLLRYKQKCI